MLNIPDSIKALYQRDDVQKNFRVQFPNGELPDITNENVVAESVRLTESLCSQEVLKFGLTEAPVIEFETVGVANMYGMKIECFSEIDTSSLNAEDLADIQAMTDLDGELVLEADSDLGWGFYRLPLGVFHVDSCPRSHGQMSHRRVTAYGNNEDEAAGILDRLFARQTKSSQYIINLAGLYEIVTGGSNVTHTQETLAATSHTSTNIDFVLYDQSRKKHIIKADAFFTLSLRTAVGNVASPQIQADAIKLSTVNNYVVYETFGRAVADLLDANGYDLTYNAKGQKIAEDNYEALQYAFPMLFSPIAGVVTDGPSGTTLSRAPYAVTFDVLEPVVFYRSRTMPASAQNAVFTTNAGFTPAGVITYLLPIYLLADDVDAEITIRNVSTGVTTTLGTARTPKTGGYVLDTYVYDTSKTHIPTVRVDKTETKNGYNTFIGAIDTDKILPSLLEINGVMGVVNRYGERRGIPITMDTPISIEPPMYSELWWDEYDVSPIGGVTIKTDKDDGDEYFYKFGGGQSIYDMTGNTVLELLEDLGIEEKTAILFDRFVPNVKDIYFTPTECDMKGLPYLEAGDYLEIDSGDVDGDDQPIKANTYIMRRTLSGIQSLTDSIESSGGEIISGGYYVSEVPDE